MKRRRRYNITIVRKNEEAKNWIVHYNVGVYDSFTTMMESRSTILVEGKTKSDAVKAAKKEIAGLYTKGFGWNISHIEIELIEQHGLR